MNFNRGKMGLVLLSGVLAVSLVISLAGCSSTKDGTVAPTTQATRVPEKPVVFAFADWDTQQFMTDLAGFIVEKGYGYKVDYIPITNVAAIVAMQNDDIDIHMEVAERSLKEPLDKLMASGKGEYLGVSYGGTWQGWLVPTYMIKGDSARSIAPLAPDLKSVFDLPKYWQLFKDPEVPAKGRFYSGIPGWQAEVTNDYKLKAYGLDKYYNAFKPGSDAALSSSMIAAFERGLPWLGYYWSPTWVLAKVDMTALEEPPFNDKLWNAESGYACAYPLDENKIVANVSLRQRAPEVAGFLQKFNLSIDDLNSALLYMNENKAKTDEAATWFLKNNESTWTKWLPAEIFAQVKAALP